MLQKVLWLALFVCVLYQAPIWALKTQTKTIQPKAFFTESENGLFEALDKKEKTIVFTPSDFEKCGQSMMRRQNSLYYACTLQLPNDAKISKLREQLSSKLAVVRFGGTDKKIRIKVNKEASHVTFSTEFDETGVDFEVTNFNNEFFKVYSKVAQIVIAEAMDKEPLKFEVLESN